MIRRLLVGVLGWALLLAACGSATTEAPVTPGHRVVASGLVAPLGLAEAADGTLLVAESGTGEDDESGGLSIVTPAGEVRRVLEGFPSSRDSGDLAGVALVGINDRGTVYVGNFGAGHLWTVPVEDILESDRVLRPDDLGQAMQPLNDVRLVNPFDIAFDADDRPVVTDASANGIARATESDTTEFTHRIGRLASPRSETLLVDAVPTGIARVGPDYFVTLTGGCPYPAGVGEVAAFGPNRSQRTIVSGLNMPIDVTRGPDGTIWVLEFAEFDPEASCFTGDGYLPDTGRLSRLVDGRLEVVVDRLNYPGAVLAASDGRIYVSAVFDGEILELTIPEREEAVPAFRETAAERGLDFEHGAFRWGMSEDPIAAMGAGLCWVDYDRDGWLDLYAVNSYSLDEEQRWAETTGLPQSQLYRNDAGTFGAVDVGSSLAIRGNGCVAADFNGDGWVDIYVTADGPNALLINRSGQAFEERAADAGVDVGDWNTAAAVGDINGDGYLDLFVAGYVDLAQKVDQPTGHFPQDFRSVADRLFFGAAPTADGVPQFADVTRSAGLTVTDRGLGAVLVDVDADTDLDLYIANDGNPNRLYENDRGTLRDVTARADVGDSGSGMGIAPGDYDGDGLADLLVTNWDRELNALYRSDAPGTFEYATYRIGLVGLGNGQTGWGTAWMDYDLDTDLDLLIVNGHVPMTDLAADAEGVRLYRNLSAEGSVGRFTDATPESGLAALGAINARGAAVADFDNDGDPDVAINSVGGRLLLLENVQESDAWLSLVAEPALPGTTVEVTLDDGSVLRRALVIGSSYLASEDPRFLVGLGDRSIERLVVRWPDGESSELTEVGRGSRLTITP